MNLTPIMKDGVVRFVLDPSSEDPSWSVVEMPEGLLPEYATVVGGAITADLARWKADMWEAIKAQRDTAQDWGCETPLGRVDTDAESRLKVAGAVQMAMIAGDAFTVDWTMQDNTTVTHDSAAMIAMGMAVGQHVAMCHEVGLAKRALLDAATTTTGVSVTEGWPDAPAV